MIQNYLVFCVNNNAKFVDGSIPSGKITANDLNRNSIFVISPFAQDTVVKAVFQPKDRAIEPMTVWTIPTDKVTPQELINPNKSYYELVKDWFVREVKVPSLVLEYISSARNTEIGITYFVQQRLVPKAPFGMTFDGYLDETTVSITNGTYKIVKPVEITWNGVEAKLNDIIYNDDDTYKLIDAKTFNGNTSTVLYGVDPAILNDNFQHLDPSTTDLVLEKLGELENDIENLESITLDEEDVVNIIRERVDFSETTSTTMSKFYDYSDDKVYIRTFVKLSGSPENIVKINDGMEVNKTDIANAIEEKVNPLVEVEQLENHDVKLIKQGGQEVTLFFPFEAIEDEQQRLESAKLDKNFTTLAQQTITNLTDELVINRGGTAYKTTLADLLTHVAVTDLFIIDTELPEVGVPNKIFLIAKAESETTNVYEEYIWVNEAWERIGSVSIDLTNYYTKVQVDTLLNGKVDKVIGTTSNVQFYTKDLNGSQVMYNATQNPNASTAMLRDGAGRSKVAAGVADTDIVNVGQMNLELNDKLDKVTTSTTYPQLYYKLVNGTQGMINFSALAITQALVQRNVLGQIEGVDATTETQLATKGQMDTALSGKQNSLGFTPENVANKTQVVNEGTPSENKYPSELALVEYVGEILGDLETLLGAI